MFSVAICIPTYNQSTYLKIAVESAFAQTYSSIEVWVSDDCSTDDTVEVLEALKQRYPALHYHRQASNLGMGSNTNWVVSQPDAPYIVRLDSDDVLHPRYVTELVSLLNQHSQAGYAHGAVQEIDEAGHARRTRRLGNRGQYQTDEESLRASVLGFRVAANICLFKSEVLRETGFYSNELGYSHDWDLAVRIADAGWGNVYKDEVLASYRVWQDAGNIRPKRKKAELQDCIDIFEQRLTPSFIRRRWNTEPLQKSRRAMALTQATVLDTPVFEPQERANLTALLLRLGDSPSLRRRLVLMKWGAGPLLRWQYHAHIFLRDRVKQLLSLVRQ